MTPLSLFLSFDYLPYDLYALLRTPQVTLTNDHLKVSPAVSGSRRRSGG